MGGGGGGGGGIRPTARLSDGVTLHERLHAVSSSGSYTALPSCLRRKYRFIKPGGGGGGGGDSALHSKLPGGGLVSILPISVDRVHHDLCHIASM